MTAIGVRRRAAPRRDRADRLLRTRSDALRGAAVAVVLMGVVGSVLLAQGWQSTVTRQRDERLDRTAASRTVTISSALANYENALQAARSLWLASGSVSRQEFSIFARSLDLGDRYPGLQGIGWRTVVTDDQADEFVARTRKDRAPGFTITPPGRRPVYYVTLYSYPRLPFSDPLGADARANPGILASLEQARTTGKTTVSNQTTLPGDMNLPATERPVAFELFVPVYEVERPTPAERRSRFLGWASGQFRAGDFLNDALTDVQRTTGVELHDEVVGGSPIASSPPGFRAQGPDVREERFAFGGRSCVLRYAPLPGNPILTERTVPASLVLAMGIGASILLGALLWLLAQVGALYREVGRLARTDSLTGVANRRAWDEELPRELARSARSRQPVCVALLDLDHFKAYNDEHGHQAGDRLLKAAAAAWEGRLRKTDLLARYGGEEFAVLLPDCALGDAMEIAERLRTAQPEVTCSIGVADWDGREDIGRLVARADRALYAAKAGGRDRCVADPAPAEPALR
jgi:diguanylate cyclase (GGDEF)-like protein